MQHGWESILHLVLKMWTQRISPWKPAKKQDWQAVLRIAARECTWNGDPQAKGCGDWLQEGHAGPKSQVRGSVGAIDQARLDEEHVRRLATMETCGPPFFFIGVWKQRAMRTGVSDASFGYLQQEGDKTEMTILAWNHSPTCVPPLIFPIIPWQITLASSSSRKPKVLRKSPKATGICCRKRRATLSWCTVLCAPSASSQRVWLIPLVRRSAPCIGWQRRWLHWRSVQEAWFGVWDPSICQHWKG